MIRAGATVLAVVAGTAAPACAYWFTGGPVDDAPALQVRTLLQADLSNWLNQCAQPLEDACSDRTAALDVWQDLLSRRAAPAFQAGAGSWEASPGDPPGPWLEALRCLEAVEDPEGATVAAREVLQAALRAREAREVFVVRLEQAVDAGRATDTLLGRLQLESELNLLRHQVRVAALAEGAAASARRVGEQASQLELRRRERERRDSVAALGGP